MYQATFFSKDISVFVYSSLFGTMAKTHNTEHSCSKHFQKWTNANTSAVKTKFCLQKTGRKPVKQLQLSSCICLVLSPEHKSLFLSIIHCLLLSGYYGYTNKHHAFGHALSFQGNTVQGSEMYMTSRDKSQHPGGCGQGISDMKIPWDKLNCK